MLPPVDRIEIFTLEKRQIAVSLALLVMFLGDGDSAHLHASMCVTGDISKGGNSRSRAKASPCIQIYHCAD
ncbi:hypothetical protein GUJ93_ZPchr0006g45157 [Zizania palustris]|uniref:Uncharacterized protein n=1 Tax=Zizania palustris TaxID=103762 RepID=A0A8J5W3U8_ZIZPA|nr:hypothetical protein GUJ93_ZPchr0006g45157 [Zizania palustris]